MPTLNEVKTALQSIGNGTITFDDYKQSYTYKELRNGLTILVHGDISSPLISKVILFDVRVFNAEEQATHKSSHYFANSTITFVGNANTMAVYENSVKPSDLLKTINQAF